MDGDDFQHAVVAAAQGDQGAFAALWRAHQPALLRYLQVVAPGAAEDLASETWLVIARQLGRFRGQQPAFRAWLVEISRRQTLDWRRRQARRPAVSLPLDQLPDQAATDDPAAAALETLSTAAAIALVATLPPDQAEVVMLRAVVGLDTGQVAQVLRKRPGTVRVLAHRGLRRLAQLTPSHPARQRVTR